MMGLIEEREGEERRFGPGHFDLIVIDEAHRSVYQKYRAIFAYFDSLLLGLTATPKDEVDRNTYGLFGLKADEPTDAYGLEEAVADGYLVPPRAITVPLKFPREGLRYADLSEAEREQWEEQDWGEDGEMPEEVDPEAVNRWLFNTDTVDKVLETLMTEGHHVAGGDRLGKTIVFAKNNEHAEFIAECFDANYPEHAGSFARVVTYRTEYAQSLIDDFSIKHKAPHIAISVDMLDTGIDVPEVVNLVFFKRVRSKTKFWQMLGRGTRLCPELYGPDEGKRDFLVFDCCDNVAYFNQEIEPSKSSPAPSLAGRLFRERLELVVALGEAAGEGAATAEGDKLRGKVMAQLQEQVAGMNPDNFLVRPQRQWVERFRGPEAWEDLDLDSATELAEHLADLPTTSRDDDEAAKRFDLVMLGLQLRRLRPQPGEEQLRRRVQGLAAGLLEQTTIPVIRERQEMLEELAGEEWWVDVTVPMLEGARRRIRGLVRLLDERKRATVYTDFVDELGEVEEVELRGVHPEIDQARFRERVQAYVRAHGEDPTVRKLRRNVPVTEADITELENSLLEDGAADAANFEYLRDSSLGLGTFVRSVAGLEKEVVTDALSGFLRGRKFTASQHDFVSLVIDHLAINGVMRVGGLYESPFAEVAPNGPEGLFPNSDIDKLADAIEALWKNTEVS
jgi:type I restriction enzyme, R subunit